MKNKRERILIITIRNLTDEKIYNVKVFNKNYKEQDKIKYSTAIGYDDLLYYQRKVAVKREFIHDNIVKIRQLILCSIPKFRKKQEFCDIKIINKEIMPKKGKTTDMATFFKNKKGFKSGISKIKNANYPFHKGLNIEYEFLMPETEIKLFLNIESVTKHCH